MHFKAFFMSSIKSLLSSIPTESLSISEVTPLAINSSSVNCPCVVVAGCNIQLLESPNVTANAIKFRFLINFLASLTPPLIPNV